MPAGMREGTGAQGAGAFREKPAEAMTAAFGTGVILAMEAMAAEEIAASLFLLYASGVAPADRRD